MPAKARIEARPAQPYAGVRRTVPMAGIAGAVDAGFPLLFGWLAARSLAPAGAPFIRYRVVAMEAELELDLGVPLSAPVAGDDDVVTDELPAGPWAVLRHTGPYDGLMAANAEVQRWAADHGVTLATTIDPDGTERWPGRIEVYLTNPSEEPDPAKWEVDVAYLVAP
jgi:effector-binding domain-containing protein